MTDLEFEKYRLNDDIIDVQHLKLFNILQSIVECHNDTHDKKVITALMKEFLKCTEDHFKHEVEIMQELYYDIRCKVEYGEHILEHRYTISEIKSFLLRQKVKFPEEFPVDIIFQDPCGSYSWV